MRSYALIETIAEGPVQWESMHAPRAQEVINDRFKRLVADVYPITVHYDNAPYVKPVGMWVRLEVEQEESEHLGVGDVNEFRYRGVVRARVFVPIEVGNKTAYDLIKLIRTSFTQVTDHEFVFETPSHREHRRQAANQAWWEIEVTIPWRADFVDYPISLPETHLGLTPAPDPEIIENMIRDRFKSRITDIVPVLTQFDNAPQIPPSTGMFVTWSIIRGTTETVATSPGRYRTHGIGAAVIFVPIEIGTKAGHDLAEFICDEFRAISMGSLTFQVPSSTNIGRSQNWWQINVYCPFYVDELGV